MIDRVPTQSRLPAFGSIEEEAEFWDTHDTAEFEDEFEPVELEFSPALRHALTVVLERDEFHRLSAIANEQGVGAVALARRWVLEALARAEAAEAAASAPSPAEEA